MLSSLFTAFSLLFGHCIEHELLGLVVHWAVRTPVYDWCLLRCSNTSLNTDGHPDASSGRLDGLNGNRLAEL
jgi:hypothetical protein